MLPRSGGYLTAQMRVCWHAPVAQLKIMLMIKTKRGLVAN